MSLFLFSINKFPTHFSLYTYSPSVSPDVRDAYFGSLDQAFVGFTFIDDSAPVNNNKMMMSGSVRYVHYAVVTHPLYVVITVLLPRIMLYLYLRPWHAWLNFLMEIMYCRSWYWLSPYGIHTFLCAVYIFPFCHAFLFSSFCIVSCIIVNTTSCQLHTPCLAFISPLTSSTPHLLLLTNEFTDLRIPFF